MSACLNINTPRIRPVSAGVWLMGMGLSGAVVAGVVPEQRAALHPTGQGLQGVILSPASIAAIAQAPTRVQVQDATGQAMPMRLETPMQPAQRQTVSLALYRWPSAQPLSATEAASLQLQLDDGTRHATLTFGHQTPALTAKGADRVWLLVAPALSDRSGSSLSQQQLRVDWPSQNLSVDAALEGSNNLIEWQSAGSGALLQTTDAGGRQIRQQVLSPQGQYRYWRMTLSEPLGLQAATLIRDEPAQPKMQQHRVTFLPTSVAGQWQLDLPHAWPLQGLEWRVPENQVWNFDLQQQHLPQGDLAASWQSVGVAHLYHWPVDAQHPTASPSAHMRLTLAQPETAQHWRLIGQGATGAMTVQWYSPQQQLLFLAQGQPPYNVSIAGSDTPARVQPALPDRLPVAQPAQMDEFIAMPTPIHWQQYGLWAVLVLVVGILAVLALRVVKQMDLPAPPSDVA